MKLQRVLQYARTILTTALEPGDIAVDCTVGNGHDTVFLAELVGDNGHVFGFDIQKQAIVNTKQKLLERNLQQRVTLFQMGHEHVAQQIPTNVQSDVNGAIFNLGYLPKGDKSIVTTPDTTISAIKQLLGLMPSGGIIVIVVYHGHDEGKIERDALLSYTKNLHQESAHVLQYGFINQKNNPPFILAIEKR